MTFELRSLQARLASRLAAAFLIATALVVGIIVYQGSEAADELSNDQLMERAADLARLVHLDPAGVAHLELSPKLAQVYRSLPAAELFLVRDGNGRVITASPPAFANEFWRGLFVRWRTGVFSAGTVRSGEPGLLRTSAAA